MTSLWELENDLNYGNFSANAPQVADAFKVEQSFKVITTEVQKISILECDLATIKVELANMTLMYQEVLEVMRKMGKDYPEVVLAKPYLFVAEEFQVKAV